MSLPLGEKAQTNGDESENLLQRLVITTAGLGFYLGFC